MTKNRSIRCLLAGIVTAVFLSFIAIGSSQAATPRQSHQSSVVADSASPADLTWGP
jgi:hypothetical protein